ncbi:DNA-binding protein [Corticibacter populi]|uniref:DNA-binding protein n=1 Tax=Corticibacter populi TaxID=1550736 RepID=A0A3M6QVA0_9BURK|nr:DNA-binding protein [Corticibacter populi]
MTIAHTIPCSLDRELRSALSTAEAAAHLNRKPQTLRIWACKENGPIRPIRINGRLAWPVAELRRVLQLTQE